MRTIRIGVQIRRVKSDGGVELLKATVPVKVIFDKDFDALNVNRNLEKFESEYIKLVDVLRVISELIKKRQGKGRVLLYWMLGDELYEFTRKSQSSTFFLERPLAHLARDTGISKKMLHRCERFRRYYPDITTIDLNRSFDSYVRTFERGYVSAKREERQKEIQAC